VFLIGRHPTGNAYLQLLSPLNAANVVGVLFLGYRFLHDAHRSLEVRSVSLYSLHA